MTGHSLAAGTSQDHPSLPNQPFFSWLRGETALFLSHIVAISGFVYFLASLVYYATNLHHGVRIEQKRIQLVVDYAHIVVIIVFIIALIRVLDDNDQGSYRVGRVRDRVFRNTPTEISDSEREEEARKREDEHQKLLRESKGKLKTFKRYFLGFWFAMLSLYVAFAFKHNLELTTRTPGIAEAAKVAIEIGPFKRSLEAGAHAKDADAQQQFPKDAADKPLEPQERLTKLFFASLVFALNNVSMLFGFLCFLVLSADKRTSDHHKLAVRWSIWIMSVFTASFPVLVLANDVYTAGALRDHIAVFDALSGALNAVVLALLIARFDSKLVGLASWLICILYFYSAVQPFFVVFDQEHVGSESIQTSVLIIVFIFKIYFFLIIMYTLQTGRLLNYFYSFSHLNKRVNSLFDGKLLPKQSFGAWLRARRIYFVIAILGILSSLLLVLLVVLRETYSESARFSAVSIMFYIKCAHLVLLPPLVGILLIWVFAGNRQAPGRNKLASYLRKVASELRDRLDSNRPRPKTYPGRRINRKLFEENRSVKENSYLS